MYIKRTCGAPSSPKQPHKHAWRSLAHSIAQTIADRGRLPPLNSYTVPVLLLSGRSRARTCAAARCGPPSRASSRHVGSCTFFVLLSAHQRGVFSQASVATAISVWYSRIPFFTGAVLAGCCALSLFSLLFRFSTFGAICLEPFFVVFAGEGAQPLGAQRHVDAPRRLGLGAFAAS